MDQSRNLFFEQLLKKFHIAGKIGYTFLKQEVESELKNISDYVLPDVKEIEFSKTDKISLELYPSDDPLCTGFEPTPVYGDGNCLCRSGSMYVFGYENQHIELRCRIIAEMVNNKDQYLSNRRNHQYAQYTETLLPADN
ncbi:vertnin-like [Mytilus edulis]|uniref:vertnin-like n=1 Tax=Mytilus edulis TaxID=6550 RepID=UPI0039EF5392